MGNEAVGAACNVGGNRDWDPCTSEGASEGASHRAEHGLAIGAVVAVK